MTLTELRLTFSPRGTATPARLKLRAEDKDSMAVSVAAADGAIHAQGL